MQAVSGHSTCSISEDQKIVLQKRYQCVVKSVFSQEQVSLDDDDDDIVSGKYYGKNIFRIKGEKGANFLIFCPNVLETNHQFKGESVLFFLQSLRLSKICHWSIQSILCHLQVFSANCLCLVSLSRSTHIFE